MINPANSATAASTLRDIPEAARAIGLQIQVLDASTSREIETAFATLVRDRADALFVAPDLFFQSRRVQLATLAVHYRIPATYSAREFVEAGGLMSYGTDRADMYRQVGVYCGQILKGAKPAELPVGTGRKFSTHSHTLSNARFGFFGRGLGGSGLGGFGLGLVSFICGLPIASYALREGGHVRARERAG